MNPTAETFLAAFGKLASSNREKGYLFERLTKEWLLNAPPHNQLYEEVWLWDEWAAKNQLDGRDIGIDLVARTYEDEYRAIQCKFFAPDHHLQKGDIDSFFTASGQRHGVEFNHRLIVATTSKWSPHADKALQNQKLPCTRLDFADELARATIDWQQAHAHLPGDDSEAAQIQDQQILLPTGVQDAPIVDLPALLKTILPKRTKADKKQIRPHQQKALNDVLAGLQHADRGKLIMACGTGKTFTALKIAEKLVPDGGNVLILVPSLALVSQTLFEWSAETTRPLRNFAVCSDSKVGRRNTEDIGVSDLAIPATTDAKELATKLKHPTPQHDTIRTNVVLSTYHSIGVVADAQQQGAPNFDLVICDEAHRTTGVESEDQTQSHFTRVHDAGYIAANKRLYMTATPRIYTDSAKSKAQKHEYDVYSMDDASEYGEELHRLDFSEAVAAGLLSDYKVLIMTVNERQITDAMLNEFQEIEITQNKRAKKFVVDAEELVKIIGCWKGLSKLTADTDQAEFEDRTPMRRAVAFTRTINASKALTEIFSRVIDGYLGENPPPNALQCKVSHVDGTQHALIKNERINWLKQGADEDWCRILSNVRCLSEGVDVPALDAVMFLHPRKSQTDIVQSVGRVMRKVDGKHYGYIILPIITKSDVSAEVALNDNETYRVVWDVLRALRSHDQRMDVWINQLDLNKKLPENIVLIDGSDRPPDSGDRDDTDTDTDMEILRGGQQMDFSEWRNAIFAKIVKKCGDREYWDTWAGDVANIAAYTIERIKKLLADNEQHSHEFSKFLTGLQKNLNPAVTEDAAIEMLAQHVITRPVFDALFGGSEFVAQNPVSKTMQAMLDLLDDHNLTEETKTLDAFYASVKRSVEGIDNSEGKQKIITKLYEKFFKTGFPKIAESLGIVYTPVEVVDFIIHSIDDLLKKEFGIGITDKNVNLLDPFTGTGTFITRLLQSSVIKDADLQRKYASEIHANEIVLLAYYIAAINIEQAYQQRLEVTGKKSGYTPFDGIALTDTFQINEGDDNSRQVDFAKVLPANSARIERQKKTSITVALGNPPYSAHQKNENNANKNIKYVKLDESIRKSYVQTLDVTLKKNLYDSYVRAIRWASDRIGDEGIVAFVTNNGYIDNGSMDGLRKCLRKEFSSIYVLNLRGNIRKNMQDKNSGEGQNIFGQGSMTGIAILFLVKHNSLTKNGSIFYYDIGDDLTTVDKKFKLVKLGSSADVDWVTLTPDQRNDWINQRNSEFEAYLSLGVKSNKKKGSVQVASIFSSFSNGVVTNRDAWVCNFSHAALSQNMSAMTDFYNSEVERYQKILTSDNKEIKVDSFVNNDPTKIKWVQNLKRDLANGTKANFDVNQIRNSIYRPFVKQHLYFARQMVWSPYLQPSYFPAPDTKNLMICISSDSRRKFSTLMVNIVPDLSLVSSSQCFPRYHYAKESLLNNPDSWKCIDNIPAATVVLFQKQYNDSTITGDDIFYYTYSILHSEQYKTKFAADLKKTLPRIPHTKTAADFRAFTEAGKKLANLHINYESASPYLLMVKEQEASNLDAEYYRVTKMKYMANKTMIQYNASIMIQDIPPEAHEYIVNGRSALDWIIDRYRIKTDKDSQLTNDPNDWSENPRYIIELIAKVVTVSVETVQIVKTLPKLF